MSYSSVFLSSGGQIWACGLSGPAMGGHVQENFHGRKRVSCGENWGVCEASLFEW